MKAWLARRIQGLLGVERLLQSQGISAQHLQDLRQTLANAQSSAQARSDAAEARLQSTTRLLESINDRLDLLASLWADPSASSRPESSCHAEMLERIESQGLFILGSARSGTSVLTRCLNSSPEVFLLEEPNFFQHEHIQDFAAFFNAMHAAMGNFPFKGTYVPPPAAPENGPLGLLHRLCRQYRYAGEKQAIGPHDYPPNWKQLFLDFNAKYFLRSRRLITIRRPSETLWSMHKLFPASPVPRLFEAWLESLSLSIDVYRVCPNSSLMFFEDFGKPALDRLGEMLGVKFGVPASVLGKHQICSQLDDGELPPVLKPYAELCRDCSRLYGEFREFACCERPDYGEQATEWDVFGEFQMRICALVERSRAANDAQRAAA